MTIIARLPPSPSAGVLARNHSVGSTAAVAWEWSSMWHVLTFRRAVAARIGGGVRCYAARSAGSKVVKKKKTAKMEEENAFYVLKKGGMVAIYNSLSECQAQVSSSVADPAVGVHKGYSLQKGAIDYLTSRGLKKPLYCIDATDWKDDLLGPLVACPFQQPDSHDTSTEATKDASTLKRSIKVEELNDRLEADGVSPDISTVPNKKSIPSKQSEKAMSSCIVEFDGASKGNPGTAGAGVVLRNEDGSVISRIAEGLGQVTNNVAEYRAVILGMKFALNRGFSKILMQGDSKLICMQLEGLWKIKDTKMIELYKEAKKLKNSFLSFKICHVMREFNSDADHQANLGAALPCGEIKEVIEGLD